VEILFDEIKRFANLEKHGFDFVDLTVDFFIGATYLRGNQPGRFLAINRVAETVTVAVVFRPYGSEALSVISMRHATPSERRVFDAQH